MTEIVLNRIRKGSSSGI